MPTLLVHRDGLSKAHLLPASTIVGRAAGCALRMDDRDLPMHWLEIRWSPHGWCWRTLAGEARTRGVGSLLADGCRQLPESSHARPQRIRFGDGLALELVEGGPPERLLVDLQTGECLAGEAMGAVVEVRETVLLPFEADGDPSRALQDGDVVIHAARAFRVHLAGCAPATRNLRLDLARGTASVDLLDDGFRAVFHQDGSEVSLVGEHVRTLAVYAEARRADEPRGGWLSVPDAWAHWTAAGGNPDSPLERLAWDRARCRTHLARLAVGGLEQLFESRRVGGAPHYRLGIHVE